MWKGMSHNKTQISPIPPEGYGNRFVKFITGLTMTKEEVEREHRSTDQTDGSIHTDRQPSFSLSRQSTDKVIQRAEKQAQKTEKQGASEDSRRDRTLSALRSSSAERSSGLAGATLPVVEEAGEAGSREDSLGQETLERQISRDPALGGSLKQRPQEAPSTLSSSGHKHLPSLPFIPRLSMNMSASSPTKQ